MGKCGRPKIFPQDQSKSSVSEICRFQWRYSEVQLLIELDFNNIVLIELRDWENQSSAVRVIAHAGS